MSDFLNVFKQLNDHKIAYVLVGGLAVVLHGYNRFTSDIDLVLDLSPENCRNAINAFTSVGFIPRVPVTPTDFADTNTRENWIKEKGLTVFSMYFKANPLIGIDLFVREPMPFSDLYERAEIKDLAGVQIRVASIDDLIIIKTEANREKDLEDIKFLKTLKDGR